MGAHIYDISSSGYQRATACYDLIGSSEQRNNSSICRDAGVYVRNKSSATRSSRNKLVHGLRIGSCTDIWHRLYQLFIDQFHPKPLLLFVIIGDDLESRRWQVPLWLGVPLLTGHCKVIAVKLLR
jgi:hypothetical protein